jgi:hypothetical protein
MTDERMTIKYVNAIGVIGQVFGLQEACQIQEQPAESLYAQLKQRGWHWNGQTWALVTQARAVGEEVKA